MELTARLSALLEQDPIFITALDALTSLRLPDGWIAAGAIRNLVWDRLHDLPHDPTAADTDVIYFRPGDTPDDERAMEARLRSLAPDRKWSVRNQARMHIHNNDPPYRDCADAMRHWPETATAIAAKRDAHGAVDICAPLGLADLFGLIVRPTHWMARKPGVFPTRLDEKRWRARWPKLRVIDHTGDA